MKKVKFYTLAVLLLLSATSFAQDSDDDNEKKSYVKHRTTTTHHDLRFDLGMNNWLEDGKFPNDNNALYSVRPWGSWYFAINSIYDTKITGPLHLEWGVGVSWYNFKFENAGTRISEGNNTVVFNEAPADVDTKKSKLTATYVNASFVPVLKFGNKRHHNHHHGHWHGFKNDGGFRIGAGGYAGYKIDSYTKTVSGDDNKDKDHDGFYLNNLRYGARVQIGFRGMDFFANYDLNEVFVDNKGPSLNAFSFGVIL